MTQDELINALEEFLNAVDNIKHWHDISYDTATNKCEGMVVSSHSIRELWEIRNKYKDLDIFKKRRGKR